MRVNKGGDIVFSGALPHPASRRRIFYYSTVMRLGVAGPCQDIGALACAGQHSRQSDRAGSISILVASTSAVREMMIEEENLSQV
jgi:hypothetical protein